MGRHEIPSLKADSGGASPRLRRTRPRSFIEWKTLRRWGRLPPWEADSAGYLLRLAREEAGFTQENLAQLLRCTQQAVAQAERWSSNPTVDFLRHTSEPTLRAIVVEDGAALIGLGLAAVGLLLHEFAGLKNADAIAALLIGLLLAATAFGLARPLADLLIGRSMLPARLERVYAIIERSPSIDEVLSVQAVYGAPQEVIVAAKVHPAPGKTADELAEALDDIDHSLRRQLPEVAEVFIDLTSHRVSSDDGR